MPSIAARLVAVLVLFVLIALVVLSSNPLPEGAWFGSRGRRGVAIVVVLLLGNTFSEVRSVPESDNSPQPP